MANSKSKKGGFQFGTLALGVCIGVIFSFLYFNFTSPAAARKPDTRPVKELLDGAYRSFSSKNYERSKELYKDVLVQDPENYDANMFLSTLLVSYTTPPDHEQALVHLKKVLSLKKDRANKVLYGQTLWATHRYQECEDIFREVLKENSIDANSWEYLGFALMAQKKKKEALSAFEKALKIEPTRASAKTAIEWAKSN